MLENIFFFFTYKLVNVNTFSFILEIAWHEIFSIAVVIFVSPSLIIGEVNPEM